MKKKLVAVVVVLTALYGAMTPAQAGDRGVCPTPKSLMLHTWFQPEMVGPLVMELRQKGYVFVTYEDIVGRCPRENEIIISLDDMSVLNLQPSFVGLLEEFRRLDVPIVIGVITYDNRISSPEVWAYLRQLQAEGFEVASHGATHADLSFSENISEILQSYRSICKNSLRCPVSLILPYGAGWGSQNIQREAEDAGYKFLVSILAPDFYHPDQLGVLRRVAPDPTNVQLSLARILYTFRGPWAKEGVGILCKQISPR